HVNKPQFQTGLFINNEFVDAVDGGTIDVLNPFDNSLLAKVAEARPADIDRAVAAARKAFPAWSAVSPSDRGLLIGRLADAIEKDRDNLSLIETLDTGHPIRDTRNLDVMRTVATFRYFAGMPDKNEGTVIPVDTGFLNYVTRVPVGVVGQVVPWNFPLMFTSWKLGPALAAGNCVVMKQAELTPLSTLRVAELAREVGFPPGVINVVPGYGHIAGQYLAEHPGVDKISFTGSTATGRKIVQASAGNLKRVQLELGGKGANIVFDDADITNAVNGAAFAIFHNQGQACIAGSRLMLQEKIADQFLDHFLKLAASIRLGDPLDPKTEMGPLTSKMHQERVLNFCKVAQSEGGEILLGGKAPAAAELQKGCFVEPTVVRAKLADRVCQEEVFGPFVTVTTFRDDAEVLAMANNTTYGLGGGLWTSNLQRAHVMARNMEAGMVWINCYKRFHPGSPFGGIKDSGYGREMGHFAMHEYTEPKSVWVNVDARLPVFYPR
ncbi:MAG TPA: aldehyde dehydrogenase family protein, partial [Steroidobacteraceae bacterium]|nr:aldehyde dehydrogenase family protein [Steroidobacteraceae bacterium]